MKTAELRAIFLNYFKERGHEIVSSSSLIPANDPTLLFTNAGMVQFKDIFLGLESRDYRRAATVQRCLRAGGKHNDLENVGYTARHLTFFEMLGNFSFGDYFKRDAIKYAWDFLTNILHLPPEKLWVTAYEEDQEAEDIWLKEVGVSSTRFSRCGAKDNFWSMGDTGPCGPSSEIFYDHGAHIPGGPPGSADDDGDRYVEIWNLVFMQFDRNSAGEMTQLPKPSVDTGMGLERLAAVMQGCHSNYDIDLFQKLMRATADIIGVSDSKDSSIKVIADHIRSSVFLAIDGVSPSNEGRGYVMRRIIRRALRHGFKLGAKPGFLHKLVAPLVSEMSEAYSELGTKQPVVEKIIRHEEQKFSKTLEQGMAVLEDYISSMQNDVIAGEVAFKLYDTYGFPLDLTRDIARERSLQVDVKAYNEAMAVQRDKARKSSNFKTNNAFDFTVSDKTEFVGYESLHSAAKILKIYAQGQPQDLVKQDGAAALVLDKTPFYAESGGQIADSGTLISDTGLFEVADVQKEAEAIIHFGTVTKGEFRPDMNVAARVDSNIRNLTAANHSATHLLHAALRQVLGGHVSQKGSMVTSDRIRFDFSNPNPVSREELKQIEILVNQHIDYAHPVVTEIMDIESAKQQGAMALFGEKYADKVRVLSMGDFSKELCGGTHVANTRTIGQFKIISETGIAAGVRRIEAVAAGAAFAYLNESDHMLTELGDMLKAGRGEIVAKLKVIMQKQKILDKEIDALNLALAKNQGSDLASQAVEINGCKVLFESVEGLNNKALREAVDELKSRLEKAVILLAGVSGEKISLVCGVTNNSTEVIKAGDIVRELAVKIGGKGGGRADMAQGGGSDVEALPEALVATREWVIGKLD